MSAAPGGCTPLRLEDKTQFPFDRSDRDVCRSRLRTALYLFPDPVGADRRLKLRPFTFGTSRNRFSGVGFRAGNREPFMFVVEEPSPARVFGAVRDRDDIHHPARPYPRHDHFRLCQRCRRPVDRHRALPQYAAITKMRLLRTGVRDLWAGVKSRVTQDSRRVESTGLAARYPRSTAAQHPSAAGKRSHIRTPAYLKLCSSSQNWAGPLGPGKWSAAKISSPSPTKQCGKNAQPVRSLRGREDTSHPQRFPCPPGPRNSRDCGHSDPDRTRSGPCLVPRSHRYAQRPVRSSTIEESYRPADNSHWLARNARLAELAKVVRTRAGHPACRHSCSNAGLHDEGRNTSIRG